MPFDDVTMLAVAAWVYRRELVHRNVRDNQIRNCLQQLDRLHMREPVNQFRQQWYWDTWIDLRCILVELAAEQLVSEWCFAWAEAYLRIRPKIQYV